MKKMTMSTKGRTKKPPNLGEQLETIYCFIMDQEEREAILDRILGYPPMYPPACEQISRPAKIESWEDYDIPKQGTKVPNRDGHPIEFAEFCPYCKTLVWHRANPDDHIECWYCHGTFRWV